MLQLQLFYSHGMLKLQLDLFYAVCNVESKNVLFARNAKFTVVLVEITIVIVFFAGNVELHHEPDHLRFLVCTVQAQDIEGMEAAFQKLLLNFCIKIWT
jgi:hypothetical protein